MTESHFLLFRKSAATLLYSPTRMKSAGEESASEESASEVLNAKATIGWGLPKSPILADFSLIISAKMARYVSACMKYIYVFLCRFLRLRVSFFLLVTEEYYIREDLFPEFFLIVIAAYYNSLLAVV